MKYWFTADFHEGHANIIKYCNRPFNNIEEMHRKLVKNFNERVKEYDTVFHDGDFNFYNTAGGKVGEGIKRKPEEYLKDFNGRWIFIKGNHDRNNKLNTLIESIIIKYGRQKINIVHNPIHISHKITINLTGHVHDLWKFKQIKTKKRTIYCINIGIDVWGYKPVSLEEIFREFNKWKRGVIDEKGYKLSKTI